MRIRILLRINKTPNTYRGFILWKGKNYQQTLINGVALGFSIAFLISSLAAGIYTRDLHNIFHGWYLIMTSPSPLVTDYLEIGGLPSAMLNAGACGMACWLFMVGLKGEPAQAHWPVIFL